MRISSLITLSSLCLILGCSGSRKPHPDAQLEAGTSPQRDAMGPAEEAGEEPPETGTELDAAHELDAGEEPDAAHDLDAQAQTARDGSVVDAAEGEGQDASELNDAGQPDGNAADAGAEAGTVCSEPPLPACAGDVCDVVELACGGDHNCALRSDGSAWCWGAKGPLGAGYFYYDHYIASPLRVADSLGPITKLRVGGGGNVGFHADGSALAWGNNNFANGANASALLAGYLDADFDVLGCGLKPGGGVDCWGYPPGLGDPARSTLQTRYAPGAVVGLTAATRIEVGASFACALRSDETLWCWGVDTYGQLGDGPPAQSRETPGIVPGLAEVVDFDLTSDQACAVVRSGEVFCWGGHPAGMLGNGSTGHALAPVNVSNLHDAIRVGVGTLHSCALRSNGQIRCWGFGNDGELGTGTRNSSSLPVDVQGMPAAQSVCAGENHTCALAATGQVYCWGDGNAGQAGAPVSQLSPHRLGWPPEARTALPLPAACDACTPGCATLPPVQRRLVSARNTSCLLRNGELWCWGEKRYLWPGEAGGLSQATARRVESWSDVQQVAVGYAHYCALRAGGALYCWGNNEYAQLGTGANGPPGSYLTPTRVLGFGAVVDVAAGGGHTCLRESNGKVWCWGRNDGGQTGKDTPIAQFSFVAEPAEVPTLVGSSSQLAAGFSHTCSLDAAGQLRCWGRNQLGQVGPNLGNELPTPQLLDLDHVTQVTGGLFHSCAQLASGHALCWGNNDFGQLGNGSFRTSEIAQYLVPTSGMIAGLAEVIDIAAGRSGSCALTRSGDVYCWGRNDRGVFGSSTLKSSAEPVLAAQIPRASELVVGGDEFTQWACVRADENVYCWGSGGYGQLGNGQTLDSAVPVRVGLGP